MRDRQRERESEREKQRDTREKHTDNGCCIKAPLRTDGNKLEQKLDEDFSRDA